MDTGTIIRKSPNLLTDSTLRHCMHMDVFVHSQRSLGDSNTPEDDSCMLM